MILKGSEPRTDELMLFQAYIHAQLRSQGFRFVAFGFRDDSWHQSAHRRVVTEASLHFECRCRLDCLGVCLRVGSAIADGRPQELRVTLFVIIACATAAADVDVGSRARGDSCGTFV